jgi:hypothetical protein
MLNQMQNLVKVGIGLPFFQADFRNRHEIAQGFRREHFSKVGRDLHAYGFFQRRRNLFLLDLRKALAKNGSQQRRHTDALLS